MFHFHGFFKYQDMPRRKLDPENSHGPFVEGTRSFRVPSSSILRVPECTLWIPNRAPQHFELSHVPPDCERHGQPGHGWSGIYAGTPKVDALAIRKDPCLGFKASPYGGVLNQQSTHKFGKLR